MIDKEKTIKSATIVSIFYLTLGIFLFLINYIYYHIFMWIAIFGLIFTIIIIIYDIMAIQKANISCDDCEWMLLTDDEENIVFCQNPKCMINNKFKRVKP